MVIGPAVIVDLVDGHRLVKVLNVIAGVVDALRKRPDGWGMFRRRRGPAGC
jgi:hypothetical protein